jgi:twitching motility protein PilJ
MSSNVSNLTGRMSGYGLRVWLGLLTIAILVFLANFIVAARLSGQETSARSMTSDLRVLSQQLAKYSREAVEGGNAESFDEFKATKTNVDQLVLALRKGGTVGGETVPGYEGSVREPGVSSALKKVTDTWTKMSGDANRILKSQDQIVNLSDTANSFNARIPQISARLDEVVRAMSDAGAPASQINLANRQIVLAERMRSRVTEILSGGDRAVTAADALSRDSAVFGQVLAGLKNGNDEVGVQRVTSTAALDAVNAVDKLYAASLKEMEQILQASTDLFEVQTASQSISGDSNVLLENAQALQGTFGSSLKRLFPNNLWAIVSGAAALVAILGLLLFIRQRDNQALVTTRELNQRNQEAILRLLDEMGSLAEGDLTVKATVTEDITGAIADSINFTVDELRRLVGTINETAVQVSAAAQETQATAMHLAEAAEHQAQQIDAASAQIKDVASSIETVSRDSAESADVAHRSVQIAAKGAEVVRQTIQGMDNIRDQIQETSKRIKRLGESSQEIGSIVELINDISEQTNILALNAAIQAASAGEAGRGFAVVADEVQRLAERASNATKRIETLVQTIQSDTNEAVSSMEQTTAEVVAGARLAEDAGLALGEIEKVSTDLADLIQNISTAARQQSVAATNITATMSVIQEITTQTSQGANQTAESIGNLAQLAADLRRSVADFKLPAL